MVRFRPGRAADIATLQAIERAAAVRGDGTGLYDPDTMRGTSTSAFEEAAGAGQLEVATVDELPVGFLLSSTMDGTFYLGELSVLPAFGRQGIGRQLVGRGLALASARGFRAVTLTTSRDIAWNEPFYRTLGFEEVEPAVIGPTMLARWREQGGQHDRARRIAMRRRVGLTDLHRHLDGSLRPDTLRALAGQLPDDLPFHPGMGLAAALSRFAFTLRALQEPDAVRRVASEMCEDAQSDGVTTLEIRFAPQLHGQSGSRPETIVDAALEGADGRAGLILCGLYGESPAVLEHHVEMARHRSGVVGIDLAGGPSASQSWSMADYAPAFARARDIGLGRTVHAGEGRPPAEIRVAIEVLHAQRVGHGTTLLDDPSVVDLVRRAGVTIEACPTSNWHVGAIPEVDAHPLPTWLAAGIPACVCCDNTLLSQVVASEEHRRAAAMPGMTEALLQQAIDAGHAARFQRA